jgi:hypothetical protein
MPVHEFEVATARSLAPRRKHEILRLIDLMTGDTFLRRILHDAVPSVTFESFEAPAAGVLESIGVLCITPSTFRGPSTIALFSAFAVSRSNTKTAPFGQDFGARSASAAAGLA